MSPLRQHMIEDMKLAGLSAATHGIYINAVRALAAHFRRSPDQLSEQEVRAYRLSMRDDPEPTLAGSNPAVQRKSAGRDLISSAARGSGGSCP